MSGILITKWKRALCAAIVLALALILAAPAAAFAAQNPLMITVKQAFTASSESVDATFTYRLKPLEAGWPMPEGSTEEGYTFTINGNDSVQLGPLDFSKQSICRYELFQVIGKEKQGYTYDKQIYTIEVWGSPEGRVEYIVNNRDGSKSEDIGFENSYDPLASDPKLMADPPVSKTVSGNPAKPGTFTFRLEARDPSSPMPQGSTNGVKTINITGSGKGEFGTWSYKKAGTYYYTVSEVNAGENGYTYDTAVYTITDTVKDGGGRLVLSRIVTNHANKQVTSLTFINKYSTLGGPNGGGNGAGGNQAGQAGDGPKTGDDTNITLYIILIVIGGGVAAGAGIYLAASRKRRK